jgi:hypothetical protein
MKHWMIAGGLMAVITIAVVARLTGADSDQYEHNGMPKCQSAKAKEQLNHVLENSPIYLVQGLSIIRVENGTTLMTSKDGTHCWARVTMNNGSVQYMSYWFLWEPDGYSTHAKQIEP